MTGAWGCGVEDEAGEMTLYETARWYLALAWVKRNDVDAGEARGKALGLARDISRSYSRYKGPARQLAAALRL